MVAVDGTKLTASASSDSNVEYHRIAREIIAEAIATDEAEDELHGDARGDELPPELQLRPVGAEWLERELAREQQAESENDPAECVEEEVGSSTQADRRTGNAAGYGKRTATWSPTLAGRAARFLVLGLSGCGSAPGSWKTSWTQNAAATRPMRTFASIAGCSKRKLGGPTKPYTPPDIPAGEMNLTDPDSRRMKGNRRYIQGYNPQAVVNDDRSCSPQRSPPTRPTGPSCDR